MTDEQQKVKEPSYWERLKKAASLKSIAVIIALGYLVGEKAIDLMSTGAEVEFNNKVGAAVQVKMKDKDFVSELIKDPVFLNAILESDDVKEYSKDVGQEIRNQIVEEVSKSDSVKVSTRAHVAKELDIRDEAYFPLLVSVLRAYKDGELMTKEDADDYIKEEIRRQRRVATF